VAAQIAVQETVLQLKTITRKAPDERAIDEEQATLQMEQTDLSNAVQDLSAADREVGIVHTLVRQKGFLVEFGVEFSGRQPEKRELIPSDDGSALVSDCGLGGSSGGV
jgi:hypothetical protein